MARYLDWFFGNLGPNLSSHGFRDLLVKTAAFMVVEFGLLYSLYAPKLESPVAAALMPVVQQLILLVLFCVFSWKVLAELPSFPIEPKMNGPFLVLALVLVGYRATVAATSAWSRLAMGLALGFLFIAIFGVSLLRHLMHHNQKQLVYTSIAFLYFLYALNIQGDSLTHAISMLVWSK